MKRRRDTREREEETDRQRRKKKERKKKRKREKRYLEDLHLRRRCPRCIIDVPIGEIHVTVWGGKETVILKGTAGVNSRDDKGVN